MLSDRLSLARNHTFDGRVYRNAEDPDDIVIVANVSDLAKARAWTANDDLKTAMQKAGMLGPQFI